MQNIYLKHNYQLVYPGCKVKSQSSMRFELQEIRTIAALIKTKKKTGLGFCLNISALCF